MIVLFASFVVFWRLSLTLQASVGLAEDGSARRVSLGTTTRATPSPVSSLLKSACDRPDKVVLDAGVLGSGTLERDRDRGVAAG